MNKYDQWLLSVKKLKEEKQTELRLRNEIIDSLNIKKVQGTLKFTKGDYRLKVGLVVNKSIDESILDSISSKLSDKEKACLRYKPSLKAKELKELEGKEKLFECITEKPGQATLEIDLYEQ